MNIQERFDRNNKRHICQCCSYENDTTFENIAGVCSDCNKKLPDPNATLCADCRQVRREKAKEWLINAGKIIGVAADAVGVVALAVGATDDSDTSDYTPLPDRDNDDNDEVYGLGEGNYPSCKTCGADMTEFDGWAWYTCPECGDKVRIIEGQSTWYNEIFDTGKKQHHSDFELLISVMVVI